MKKELDLKLTGTFPKMYRNRYEDRTVTCMSSGFAVNDGWFDLLWKLSVDVQAELDKLDLKMRDTFIVEQVKEKFGGLRFYFYGGNTIISRLVEKAEADSYKICELCSKPGELRKGGWLVTLCEDCHKIQEAKRKKEWDDYHAKKKRRS